jgi:hypothetical protein
MILVVARVMLPLGAAVGMSRGGDSTRNVLVGIAAQPTGGSHVMTIEDLVPLTNGLTVIACGNTLVCDRARITPIRNDAIDMKFLMAGTDFVPRLRLLRERVLKATPDEVRKIVQRVAKSAIACG